MKSINKIIRESLNQALSEGNKSAFEELQDYLLYVLDLEMYDGTQYDHTLEGVEGMKEMFRIFQDEFEHDIKKNGVKKALENFLRGAHQTLDLPMSYHDVRNLMYTLGFDQAKEMDDDELDNFYYKTLVDAILSIIGHK